jgi:hypothetical protein
VNLFVTVAFLPESVPQKLQLIMKAVMITKNFGTVHHCGNYSMVAGWVSMKPGVYLVVGLLCTYAQKVIISPVNICVLERKVVMSFHLRGEL